MFDTHVFEILVWSPSVQGTVALFLLSLALQWLYNLPPRPKFSEAELDDNDWHGSLMRAKAKFQNRPFIFGKPEKRIILPNYLFEEVKDLPDDQFSFRQQIYKFLNGKYTGLATDIPPLANSIKSELTMNINLTLAILQDEIQYAVEEGIGNCPDWTPVKVFEKLLRIVALASSRIFVGRSLCRDEEWLKLTTNFTIDVINATKTSQKIHPYLRPFLVPFIPSIYKAAKCRQKIAEKLKPQLDDIIEASRQVQNEKDDAYDDIVPSDEHCLAAWSLVSLAEQRHYEKGRTPTAQSVADTVLGAAFAAIHTTSMTLTNVLYDLAAHPEYIEILREEIERISAEEPSGKIRKKTMPKLKKLDSFIKESQRIHPIGPVTRLVTARKGIYLSSGDYLPYNSLVSVAAARQTSALDPKYLTPTPPQPSLDEFHPWRFSDLRSYAGEENKQQFVTTTAESTYFGHGRFACPGRFFASNEMKSILIQLLARYDIGVGPSGQGELDGGDWKRPVTVSIEMGYYPDPAAYIYFKDRKQ